MVSGEKIVVFGGSGYVGGEVSRFLKGDFSVTVADVKPLTQSKGLSFVHCDVRDLLQVRAALDGASAALYFSIIQIPQINTERRLGYEVNVLGLQNVCEATLLSPTMKGMILAGTWHVFGERGLSGTIDESFGSRPDKVEERARLYALSKVVQEELVRFYDEMATGSGKVFGVIRMGTVLGVGMPEATAANLFIKKGLMGEPLTPYRHSMHRPMLYVDIRDICKGFEGYVRKIVGGEAAAAEGSLGHIVNLFWPEPITILDLANLVRDEIKEQSGGRVEPHVRVEDKGLPDLFTKKDKTMFTVDGAKAASFLGMKNMTSPKESLKSLVMQYLSGVKS